MDSEELLAQLADIHLPEPISYWPPAPGWWVLGVILILLAYWLVNRSIKQTKQRKIREQALAELDRCYDNYAAADSADPNGNKLRFVNQANSVFKRVALYHFPNADIAGLGGADWVDFIKQKGQSELLNDPLSHALSHGRFQTQIDVDVDQLYDFGKQWISSLYSDATQAKPAEQLSSNPNQEVTQ